MRRNITILLLLAAAVLTFESGKPAKMKKSPVKTHQAYTTYTWFEDEDLTAPVGTMCDVNVEIARLQSIFGGYTFTTMQQMNLHEYEWGWNYYFPTVIIYSDR